MIRQFEITDSWEEYSQAPEYELEAESTNLDSHQLLARYASNFGVLRGEWKNEKGKIEVICFGTAFAVSSRVIVTCAHSIYLEKKGKACTSFTFVAGIEKGRIKQAEALYRCTPVHFLQYEPLKSGQTYAKHPIEEDIALLYLERDLNLPEYPQVGVENKDLIDYEQEISISGYPSQEFFKCVNIFDACFEKRTLHGSLLQINGSAIYHDLKTSVGHSGSAIIGCDLSQTPVVLGVHTHKGSKRNSGVYLTNSIINRLIQYEINFALHHQEYKLAIKFPAPLRNAILDDLDGETLQKILSFEQYSERNIPQAPPPMKQNQHLKQSDLMKEETGWLKKIETLLEVNSRYINQQKGTKSSFSRIFTTYLETCNLILSSFERILRNSEADINRSCLKFEVCFQHLYKFLKQNGTPQFNASDYQPQLKISPVEKHFSPMRQSVHQHEEEKVITYKDDQDDDSEDYESWQRQYEDSVQTWRKEVSVLQSQRSISLDGPSFILFDSI